MRIEWYVDHSGRFADQQLPLLICKKCLNVFAQCKAKIIRFGLLKQTPHVAGIIEIRRIERLIYLFLLAIFFIDDLQYESPEFPGRSFSMRSGLPCDKVIFDIFIELFNIILTTGLAFYCSRKH